MRKVLELRNSDSSKALSMHIEHNEVREEQFLLLRKFNLN